MLIINKNGYSINPKNLKDKEGCSQDVWFSRWNGDWIL